MAGTPPDCLGLHTPSLCLLLPSKVTSSHVWLIQSDFRSATANLVGLAALHWTADRTPTARKSGQQETGLEPLKKLQLT